MTELEEVIERTFEGCGIDTEQFYEECRRFAEAFNAAFEKVLKSIDEVIEDLKELFERQEEEEEQPKQKLRGILVVPLRYQNDKPTCGLKIKKYQEMTRR